MQAVNSAIIPNLNSGSNGLKNGSSNPPMRRTKMTRNDRNMHFYENFGALALFLDDIIGGNRVRAGDVADKWATTWHRTRWQGGDAEVTSRGRGADVTSREAVTGFVSHRFSAQVVSAKGAPIMPGRRHVAGVW